MAIITGALTCILVIVGLVFDITWRFIVAAVLWAFFIGIVEQLKGNKKESD